MEVKSRIYSLLSGILGGGAIALMMSFRERTSDKPSIVEKVKNFEQKLYQDGEEQAHLLEKVKKDAETRAKSDAVKN